MKVFYIDLTGVNTKAELHAAISGELPLPEWYGNNLDALHDVLSEHAGKWLLIIYNTGSALHSMPRYMESFAEAAAEALGDENVRIYP